jgi:4-amino-4-deoxy-L-arabinose transferase-like glycosyltransferase
MEPKSSPKNMPLKRVLKREELYLVLLKYQWLLLIAGIGVSLWTSMTFPIHQDEKVFIKVAETIVAGGAPYRDVFDNKPPGIYLLLTPFVAIFGNNLAILRLIPFTLNIIIGWLLYFICRTIINRREGVVVASLYLLISPFYQSNFILTEVPVAACLLVGTALAWRYDVSRKSRAVLWIGFWIGMAILFKQTAFVYALIIPFLLLYQRFVKNRSMLLGLYILGLSIPITLIILYLIYSGIYAESYYQIIEYNLLSYPHSSLFVIGPYILQTLLPIVLLWVFTRLFPKNNKYMAYYIYFLSLFIIISIPILLFRPYHHYWIPLLPQVLLFLLLV